MEKFNKYVIVYLTAELDAWLSKKVENGYKKASFVRRILEKAMDREARLRKELPKQQSQL